MLVDGPHFQATEDGELVFLISDGDDSRRPTEHDILEPEEEERTLHQNYYLQIPLDHPDSHRWRTEIAKYLAPLILGSTYPDLLPPHSHTHSQNTLLPVAYIDALRAPPPVTMGRLPWTLADFPQGYVLLLHKTPKPSSKSRRDFYLYGPLCSPSPPPSSVWLTLMLHVAVARLCLEGRRYRRSLLRLAT